MNLAQQKSAERYRTRNRKKLGILSLISYHQRKIKELRTELK